MPDSLSAGFALGVVTSLVLTALTLGVGIWYTLATDADQDHDE